jgi:hypothetical protein
MEKMATTMVEKFEEGLSDVLDQIENSVLTLKKTSIDSRDQLSQGVLESEHHSED